MNRYSYSQSELVHKLTSSLIPRRISNHGRAINHDATEAPTLAIEHGMFLLQLQVIRDMKCVQVDFKSGIDIYMKPPKGLRFYYMAWSNYQS